MADSRVFVQHAPTIGGTTGSYVAARGTNIGQTFTADWITELVLEGRVFQMTVGTLTGGGNVSMITGGGNGTTIDQDQPEFGVSVPLGTDLIPIEINIATQPDLGAADLDEANIVVAFDVAAAYAGDGTVTSETAINVLGNAGQSSVATAFSAATGDITDPTVSGILAIKMVQASGVVSTQTGYAVPHLNLEWRAAYPFVLRGPAAFYGYWGGTAAVPGIASVVWAEVPSGRFNVIQ